VSAARMKAQVRRDLAAQNSGARVYITQWSDVLYDTPAEWDIPQYGIRTGDKVDAILVDYKPAGQQSFAPFTGEELVTRVLYYFHRGKIVSRRGGIIPASTPIYIP
ncbi:hypothetical protein IH781_03480, partial [Patescibacteria group bacterium]|nr:hypothetical protein [Patescibacteria group bacterium]